MKKITAIFLASVMMLMLMAGCTGGGTTPTEATQPTQETTQPTQAPTQPTQMTTEPTQMGTATGSAAQILSKIWSGYGENERFACYGGTVEHSVNDAPGDLDMTNTDELTNKYLLPEEQLANVESGASLVHLMNSNIFTAAAFKLKDGADVRACAKALRDNIQKTRWLCGQPDHLLVAEAEGHLLMAFAEKGNLDTFRQKLNTAYSAATILYDEAVTA
jgi:hypothetical protein